MYVVVTIQQREDGMKFGEILRGMRAEKAITLRELSLLTDIDVGYLSRVERCSLPPPQKPDLLDAIVKGIGATGEEEQRLRDQAATDNDAIPEDVRDKVREMIGVPLLLRTVANKGLSAKELENIAKYIDENY